MIENNGAPLTISKTKTATIQMKITDISMYYENIKFVLYASCEKSHIRPAISEPMFAIRYRLTIEQYEKLDWEERYVWYKDMGGNKNWIALHLGLRDSNEELIARKVPLRVSLLYMNGMKALGVRGKDIFTIHPDTKLLIDETGEALLELRINDVSKNHVNQSFIIQVSPDTTNHPLNNDISPAFSIPIEVRSKKKKRTRDLAMSNALLPPSITQRTDATSSASSALLQ